MKPPLLAIVAVAIITLSSHCAIAQSEFLRFRQTGVGGQVSIFRGEDTDHAYGVTASISYHGLMDLAGTVNRSWLRDGPSAGYDAQEYRIGAAFHPRKSKSSTGLQPRLAVGFSWLKLRGLSFPYSEPDDLQRAPFVEGGLYGAPEPGRRPAVVPSFVIGLNFPDPGESHTYYSAQLALLCPIRSGVFFTRLFVNADRDETLLGFSLGMIASLGRGWGQPDDSETKDDDFDDKGDF